MANTIDILKDTKTTTTNNNSSKLGETQAAKDKPSLFDSLLTNSKDEKTVVDAKVTPAPVDTTTKVAPKQESKTTNIQTERSVEKNSETITKSTNSLLDRIIVEARKDIKTISEEEFKNLNNKSSEQSLLDPKIVETIENNEEIKNPNNKVNAETLINPETKVEETEVKEEAKPSSEEIIKDKKIDVENNEEKIEKPKLDKVENLDLEIKNKDNNIIEKIDKTIVPLDDELKATTEDIIKNPNNKVNAETLINPETKVEETEVKEEVKNPNEKLNVLNTTIPSNAEAKPSLMDQLILKNSMNNQNIMTPLNQANSMQDEYIPKDIISNIYLSSQKNSITNQGLFNKNEAINLLKDAKSLNDVKTSAGMLNLGLENVDVDLEQNLDLNVKTDLNKKTDIDLLVRKNLLNNLMLEKNIRNEDVKGLITKSVEASNALIDNSLQLADDAIVTINSPLSYNIQSKIIGARQQMSTMMSDIAKQMYENYKPPITVFRINLNPLELGSIAILMKNDKNNALSISMNVSNNGTLDALLENQNVLRNSLNKTFEENTKFDLDFSSSNKEDNQSNNQNNRDDQSNPNRFEKQMDTQSLLQLKEENKDKEEKSIDYM